MIAYQCSGPLRIAAVIICEKYDFCAEPTNGGEDNRVPLHSLIPTNCYPSLTGHRRNPNIIGFITLKLLTV
jgi:hypothetical protein